MPHHESSDALAKKNNGKTYHLVSSFGKSLYVSTCNNYNTPEQLSITFRIDVFN
jgi:hypothetical protein